MKLKPPTPKGEPSVLNHKSVAFSPIKKGDLLPQSRYIMLVQVWRLVPHFGRSLTCTTIFF